MCINESYSPIFQLVVLVPIFESQERKLINSLLNQKNGFFC